MINVDEKKSQIVNIIKERGPMLPIQVAREVKMETIFTSAILSEMISNKTVKVSNLKVGGSPLYLLPGQEVLLENFTNYLPEKEREAFSLLKKKGVLADEKLQPAHRVALRSIRDFAIPAKINTGQGEKIFWRINSLPKEEAIRILNELIREKKVKAEEPAPKEEKRMEKAEPLKKEMQMIPGTNFEKRVHEYLNENKIKILGEIYKKKKEISLRVALNSSIGEMEMIMIAKDKKTINETDLSLAYHKGQTARTPVLLLVNGEINKRILGQIETFKSYVFLRQLT